MLRPAAAGGSSVADRGGAVIAGHSGPLVWRGTRLRTAAEAGMRGTPHGSGSPAAFRGSNGRNGRLGALQQIGTGVTRYREAGPGQLEVHGGGEGYDRGPYLGHLRCFRADTGVSWWRNLVARGDRLVWGGEVVEVLSVLEERRDRVEVILQGASGLNKVTLSSDEIDAARQPSNDGEGDSMGALAGLWGKWMEWATPRIRSAATATKPVRPFAHQDEAVFVHMLPQPRLRFLLADEPGTGKTIMSGMYIVEGRRRRVVTGKVLIIPPAHLVSKWLADLWRYFGVDAERLDSASARSPRPLRDDVDVWVLSVDLLAHNPDVLRKVAGPGVSWSLAIFDEAHRLTPTSQFLGAARQVAEVAHHLLMLTATPHRGKEWYFQCLLNTLDPGLYPVTAGPGDAEPDRRLRPSPLHFIRRMKEDLQDHDGQPLFKPRYAETVPVNLRTDEVSCYEAVLDYVDTWYDDRATLARSIYGKRAASSINAAVETLRRRRDTLATGQAGQVPPPAPRGFDDARLIDAAVDDDESWEQAERSIVAERSKDRRGRQGSRQRDRRTEPVAGEWRTPCEVASRT